MSWMKSKQEEFEDTGKTHMQYNQSVDMKETVYEMSLNEKIRTFIRLESMFDDVEFYLQGNSVAETRAAVSAFQLLMNVFARPEIKTDLMKEMDRMNASLSKYTEMHGVNTGRLQDVQASLGQMAKDLRAIEGQIGQNLKQNEFLMCLRQKDSIPGGPLVMDLPLYGHWLKQDSSVRKNDIRSWLQEFTLVKKSVLSILDLIRSSSTVIDVVAKKGVYQHTLEAGASVQILQIILPPNAPYFPELSGGRNRFTVRFLKPMGVERPVQIEQEVSFKINCCAL